LPYFAVLVKFGYNRCLSVASQADLLNMAPITGKRKGVFLEAWEISLMEGNKLVNRQS